MMTTVHEHQSLFLWKCIVFFTAVAFGSSAWAICESELNAAVSAWERTPERIDRRFIRESREIFAQEQKLYDFYQRSDYSDGRLQNEANEILDVIRKQNKVSAASDASLRVIFAAGNATSRFRLCFINAKLARSTTTAIPSNSGQLREAQTDAGSSILAHAPGNPQNASAASRSASADDPVRSQSQQSLDRVREAQTRADTDAQRKGKRSHDPAMEAHECIVLSTDGSLYGGFRNQCSYKVSYVSCNFRPKTIKGGLNFSADFDCSKQSMGGYDTGGGGKTAAHTHNTEKVYWFACKAPASAVDATFVEGEGITARCQ